MRWSLTGYQWRRSLVCPSVQHNSLPEDLFPHFHNPFLGPLSVGIHPYLPPFQSSSSSLTHVSWTQSPRL